MFASVGKKESVWESMHSTVRSVNYRLQRTKLKFQPKGRKVT